MYFSNVLYIIKSLNSWLYKKKTKKEKSMEINFIFVRYNSWGQFFSPDTET